MNKPEPSTTEPVTISGWYALTDGRVGFVTWRQQRPVIVHIVDDWSAVPKREPDFDRNERYAD